MHWLSYSQQLQSIHTSIVQYSNAIVQELCVIDATANNDLTPLHLAVHQGHSRIVERLVGYGSNLNAQDGDGDTPLHCALRRETADPISSETPQLMKVERYVCVDVYKLFIHEDFVRSHHVLILPFRAHPIPNQAVSSYAYTISCAWITLQWKCYPVINNSWHWLLNSSWRL